MLAINPELHDNEVREFLTEVLPLIGGSAERDESKIDITRFNETVRSLVVDIRNSSNNKSDILETQRKLLRVGLSFTRSCREDGNIAFQTKQFDSAIRSYKAAMRTAEWAMSLTLKDDDDDTNNKAAAAAAVASQRTFGEEVEIIPLLLRTIACACASNGALCLIQQNKPIKAQQWCSLDLSHIEEITGDSATMAELDLWQERLRTAQHREEDKSTLADAPLPPTPWQLIGIGLKMRFRLGQALELQNAFREAIDVYRKCAGEAAKVVQTMTPNIVGEELIAVARRSMTDCDVRIAACGESLKTAKGRAAEMFA